MAIGMSPEEFWHGPLALCGAYRKAWEIQQDQRFASEWRQGLYVHEAFSTVMDHAFSKAATSTYPDAPLFSSQKIREEIEDIFAGLGYIVADGPYVETTWYNFTALNAPADHPSRSARDSFYVVDNAPEGKELLEKWGLPTHLRGVGNCILGYPDCDHPNPAPRKEGRIVKIG